MVKLNSESHWKPYKEVVERSNMVCWEVIIDICCRPMKHQNDAPVMVENMTHESTISHQIPTVAPNSPPPPITCYWGGGGHNLLIPQTNTHASNIIIISFFFYVGGADVTSIFYTNRIFCFRFWLQNTSCQG
jgi:hypothetical protein